MTCEEAHEKLKAAGFSSRKLGFLLGVNSRITREWISGRRQIPTRWLAAIEACFTFGISSLAKDSPDYFRDPRFRGLGTFLIDGSRTIDPENRTYIAERPFAGKTIRRDGRRTFVKNP